MDAHFGSWDMQVPLLLPKSAAQTETLDSDIEERCWGPKKGQKGPFGALNGKIRMYGCKATEIAVVLAPTYLW